MVPIILLFLDNLTKKKYETTKSVANQTKSDIEKTFLRTMIALENQDLEELKIIYDTKLYDKYYKKIEKYQRKDRREYIKKPQLDGITNYKSTKDGFSVDLSYKAISYSKFDQNRIELYWRRIDYFFTPLGNGVIGSKTDYTKYKQRWWFKQSKNQLKIVKIKKFYIKDN